MLFFLNRSEQLFTITEVNQKDKGMRTFRFSYQVKNPIKSSLNSFYTSILCQHQARYQLYLSYLKQYQVNRKQYSSCRKQYRSHSCRYLSLQTQYQACLTQYPSFRKLYQDHLNPKYDYFFHLCPAG